MPSSAEQFALGGFENFIGKFFVAFAADRARQHQRADQAGHGGDAFAAALRLGPAGRGFGQNIDQRLEPVGERVCTTAPLRAASAPSAAKTQPWPGSSRWRGGR